MMYPVSRCILTLMRINDSKGGVGANMIPWTCQSNRGIAKYLLLRSKFSQVTGAEKERKVATSGILALPQRRRETVEKIKYALDSSIKSDSECSHLT